MTLFSVFENRQSACIGCLISPLILSNARYFPSFKKTAATLCAWGLALSWFDLMTGHAHSHVVTCVSCWEKRVFNPVDVVILVTCHFIIEFLDFFGCSRCKFLIRHVAGKYFIPFRDSSAHVPDGALGITRAFMFDEIHFIHFRSIGCALVLHVRNCKAGAPSREEREVHPPWGGCTVRGERGTSSVGGVHTVAPSSRSHADPRHARPSHLPLP